MDERLPVNNTNRVNLKVRPRPGESTVRMGWRCLQEKQRAEAAAKKLEAKKMAEAEKAALASSAKKTSSKSAGTPKEHPAIPSSLWTLRRPSRAYLIAHNVNVLQKCWLGAVSRLLIAHLGKSRPFTL